MSTNHIHIGSPSLRKLNLYKKPYGKLSTKKHGAIDDEAAWNCLELGFNSVSLNFEKIGKREMGMIACFHP